MSLDPTDPALLFGGTWERIQGKFLLASNDEYEVGSTGGEATHRLTVAEMPSHTHGSYYSNFNRGSDSNAFVVWNSGQTSYTHSAGNNAAHNNMPPYLAVYIWQRMA